jgi:hypothetical protein
VDQYTYLPATRVLLFRWNVRALLEALEIPGYSSFTILCPGRLASRRARVGMSPFEQKHDGIRGLFHPVV